MALGQAPLRVLCSNGVRAAVEKMDVEKAIGMPVSFQYGTSNGLKAAIDKGDSFDVALLTMDLIDGLIKDGKLKADSRVAIARSGIGVGIRKGAKHPDIGSPEAMKQTLLNVKSLTYAREGASRPFLNKMYERMGIAATVEPKVVLEAGSTQAAARVAAGQSDMILTLISEIKPVEGIELVGPLPKEFQNYVSFSGSVSPQSKNAAAGEKLLKFLASQGKAFEAIGMEQVKK
jgi:molybdate transport system substrate-binding protein